MIVVMKNGANPEEIAATVVRIKALGLKAHVIEGQTGPWSRDW